MNAEVAQRYAAALADAAIELRDAGPVTRGLDAFLDAFFSAPDLRHFLESPAASAESKRRVIEKLAEALGLVPAVRNFLYLVVDHRRTEILGEIRQALRDELNQRLGVAEARVISARDLSEAERRELTAALERRTGKKIEATFERDEELLGGAVVRVGSTVYDGSIRERLARLRQQLESE
ncbi:MAG TPA: ATP synthase F1 subunit delta [Candidatus Acidoferrales bacterium]|nr:ATP synthase F1 subunit delta [Candidatus Acidoferrales bacterium]